MFPRHIGRVLDQYGVRADTKAALYDLYVSMGDEVLEVFSDLAERVSSPAFLAPEDTGNIRARVVERYLRRCHPQWLEGHPTASLWHPRVLEGRASGLAVPLGRPPEAARRAVGDGQVVPEGMLLLGRNAHYGGRQETVSFDIVADDLEEALRIGGAEGQQHTLPGSMGETSGTLDSVRSIALIWEVQPNVYKPAGDRNRGLNRLHRRHRSWHLATLASAIEWLSRHAGAVYILRGSALAAAHEVNPAKPVSEAIAGMHDRTVHRVAEVFGRLLRAPGAVEESILLESLVYNHALRGHVQMHGATATLWRLE